jgi:Ca2+/Na+ antiporter
MYDWIFAFFHLFLLIGVVLYAFYSLYQGNLTRFALLMACLAGYYLIVLHKPVRKEIARRRKAKR